jgi:hypothetical protein
VRNTAAKQLAQLAVKSVTDNTGLEEEDTKVPRQQHVSLDDPTAWSELMAVVARVRIYFVYCFNDVNHLRLKCRVADHSISTLKSI